MPQPLADDVQRDPRGGQLVTGRAVPKAMSSRPLAHSPGRLLIKTGMFDARPQVAQDRLPGLRDDEVARTVGCAPVGEQSGEVRVKGNSSAPAALAAADQQGVGREVYVPPLQGHGLTDPDAAPPHGKRRRLGAAKP